MYHFFMPQCSLRNGSRIEKEADKISDGAQNLLLSFVYCGRESVGGDQLFYIVL
jgi:hypothetical protein